MGCGELIVLLRGRILALLDRVTEGLPRDRLALHVCRGNGTPDEAAALRGDWRPPVEFVARAPVGTLRLEMSTPRAGDEAVLEAIPRDKRVGLGAADQELARVETVEEVVARLELRLKRFGADRLLLVPDCGFATFCDNPISTPEVAERKLGVLAGARRTLFGPEREAVMTRLAAAVILLAACTRTAGNTATPRELSVSARQEFTFTVPDGTHKLRAWLTMPQHDPNQRVTDFKVDAPVPTRIEPDSEGNTFVYLEIADPPAHVTVRETFDLTRREENSGIDPSKTRPISDDERRQHAKYLLPNTNVIIDDEIEQLSAKITGGETNPILAARKLYDWTLQNVDYWVKYPDKFKASGIGSTEYCLRSRTGNCTDFHSLWASLARAGGIPTQIVYGSFFKKELDGRDADQSYHCWPEFYVPSFGWVPHDVAIADIYMGDFPTTQDNDEKVRLTTGEGYRGADLAKVNYYFGNIDERRVTWSRGRDLILSPRQDGGPVNSIAKAYVEVDGQSVPDGKGWTRKLTFVEKK